MSSSSSTVTIDDVARAAGVSRAAVSKVIRNAYGVSDAMRVKVQAAITELDYRPSVAARAMRGTSYTLGVGAALPFGYGLGYSRTEAGAEARYEDGVLTLTLAKRMPQSSKRLEVH